jgi:L-lactate dehydrogenase (cytochrome)
MRGQTSPIPLRLHQRWVFPGEHAAREYCGTSTIRALPKVVDAVEGRVPVFMDGGIRSGLDVLKALALGAKACFLGRAWAYALGAAGESGVRDMLDILTEELRVGMILTGCSDVNGATPDLLLRN